MGLFDIFKKKKTTVIDKGSNSNATKKEMTIRVEANNDIPSLESRIKNAYPSKNGLYPHEILMLEYASSYKTRNNSFPNFWRCNYSVERPQKLLDSLFKRRFICIGSAKECLVNEKVTKLKELLSKKGEKTTGKKAELIERILGVYDSDELEKLFPEKYYSLTELGEQELRENEYVIYSHRKRYVSAWEMNVLMNTTKDCFTYRDVLWAEFDRQCLEHMKRKDFGLYRNTKYNMYSFLVEEEKYLNALQPLTEVISYDLSGLGNSERNYKSLGFTTEELAEFKMTNLFFDEEKEEVIILPSLINCFEKLQKELNVSNEEFIKLIYEKFCAVRIKNRIFEGDECANILLSQMGLENKKVDNSYSVAYEKAKKIVCNTK